MESVNEHIINVFVLPLEIEKRDMANENLKMSGVTFRLLKAWKTGETKTTVTADEKKQLEKAGYDPEADYTEFAARTTGSDGRATFDQVKKLPEDETYILVESTTQDGYALLPQAIKVQAAVDSTYTETDNDIVVNNTANTSDWAKLLEEKATPKNRLDTAEVTMSNVQISGYFEAKGGKYVIKNSAAVTLPETGGPGAGIYYIFGGLFLGLAAIITMVRDERGRNRRRII